MGVEGHDYSMTCVGTLFTVAEMKMLVLHFGTVSATALGTVTHWQRLICLTPSHSWTVQS